METINLSGHGRPISCKIYDKTAEIRQRSREKTWLFNLWQGVKQADGTPVWNETLETPKDKRTPVRRVEFSVERPGCMRWG